MAGGSDDSYDEDGPSWNLVAIGTVSGVLFFNYICSQLDRLVKSKKHAKEMLEMVYKELSILGIVAFVLFGIATTNVFYLSYSNKHFFELIHMTLFLAAIFHSAFVGLVAMMSRQVSRRWDSYEDDELKRYKELKQQHRRTAQALGLRHQALKRGISPLKQIWLWIRHPSLMKRLQDLSEHVSYHGLRAHFIKSNQLPRNFRFAQYLAKCEQEVAIEMAEIRESVWAAFVLIVGIELYIKGLMGQAETNDDVRYLYLLAGISVIVFVMAVYFKTCSIYSTLLRQFTSHGSAKNDGFLGYASDGSPLRQKDMFWFGDPMLMLAALQFIQFLLACMAALILWFGFGDDGNVWYVVGGSLIPIVGAIFHASVLPKFIPKFTMVTHVGEMVDRHILSEALAKQQKVFRRRALPPTLRQATALARVKGGENEKSFLAPIRQLLSGHAFREAMMVYVAAHFFVVAYNTDFVEDGRGAGDAYVTECVFAGIAVFVEIVVHFIAWRGAACFAPRASSASVSAVSSSARYPRSKSISNLDGKRIQARRASIDSPTRPSSCCCRLGTWNPWRTADILLVAITAAAALATGLTTSDGYNRQWVHAIQGVIVFRFITLAKCPYPPSDHGDAGDDGMGANMAHLSKHERAEVVDETLTLLRKQQTNRIGGSSQHGVMNASQHSRILANASQHSHFNGSKHGMLGTSQHGRLIGSQHRLFGAGSHHSKYVGSNHALNLSQHNFNGSQHSSGMPPASEHVMTSYQAGVEAMRVLQEEIDEENKSSRDGSGVVSRGTDRQSATAARGGSGRAESFITDGATATDSVRTESLDAYEEEKTGETKRKKKSVAAAAENPEMGGLSVALKDTCAAHPELVAAHGPLSAPILRAMLGLNPYEGAGAGGEPQGAHAYPSQINLTGEGGYGSANLPPPSPTTSSSSSSESSEDDDRSRGGFARSRFRRRRKQLEDFSDGRHDGDGHRSMQGQTGIHSTHRGRLGSWSRSKSKGGIGEGGVGLASWHPVGNNSSRRAWGLSKWRRQGDSMRDAASEAGVYGMDPSVVKAAAGVELSSREQTANVTTAPIVQGSGVYVGKLASSATVGDNIINEPPTISGTHVRQSTESFVTANAEIVDSSSTRQTLSSKSSRNRRRSGSGHKALTMLASKEDLEGPVLPVFTSEPLAASSELIGGRAYAGDIDVPSRTAGTVSGTPRAGSRIGQGTPRHRNSGSRSRTGSASPSNRAQQQGGAAATAAQGVDLVGLRSVGSDQDIGLSVSASSSAANASQAAGQAVVQDVATGSGQGLTSNGGSRKSLRDLDSGVE